MAVVVPLEDRRLKAVLSYPHFSDAHYEAVLGDLRALGVQWVVLAGGLEVGDARLIGKGCTSVVCIGMIGDRQVALKIRRSDSSRESLEAEASNLEFANSCGVGPRLFGARKNAIAMEHIRGQNFVRWLEGKPHTEAVRRAVVDILGQCLSLDMNGLDHGELSEAKKHIIINEDGKACIIDFESASRSRKRRNLTSVVSYLFFKESVSRLLAMHINWDKKVLTDIMKGYKADPSERVLVTLTSHLKLY
ncbi:MAG: hypothetical protein QFX34_05150 [Candidatus Verstraetearchaeota archaeon]|nr:hypothetical protein [Candidatus Verstraetearchaeota archaeon]